MFYIESDAFLPFFLRRSFFNNMIMIDNRAPHEVLTVKNDDDQHFNYKRSKSFDLLKTSEKTIKIILLITLSNQIIWLIKWSPSFSAPALFLKHPVKSYLYPIFK